MYWIAAFFAISAGLLMFLGSRRECQARAWHYRNFFGTRIELQEPGQAPKTHQILYGHYVIGRWKRRADLHISDPTISRPHCVLWFDKGNFHIKPIFHRRRGAQGSYYSQVRVNEKFVPPQGQRLNYLDDVRLGSVRLTLVPGKPDRKVFVPQLLIPLCVLIFIAAMTMYVCDQAPAVGLEVGRFRIGSICIGAFLLGFTLWSLASGTPMLSFAGAVSLLLMMHNSYMLFFQGENRNTQDYLVHMLIFMAVMVLAFLVLRHQAFLNRFDWLFYLLCGGIVGLMLLNYFFGTGSEHSSAKLWIRIGSVSLQPGEFIKPMIALAAAMSYRNHKRFWCYFAVTGFSCCVLVLLQDFGTAFVIFATLLLMIYLLYDNLLISGLTILASLAAFLILLNLVPYARTRFGNWGNAMLNPDSLQQRKIIISVLSGGLDGLGIPNHQLATGIFAAESDSALAGIFAVYGLPMILATLLAYGSIVFQSCSNRSVFPMGNLLLVQAALVVFAQVMLNFCGSLDILFFTGIVAPLISSGGSGMLSQAVFMAMIAASLHPAVPRVDMHE